MLQCCRRPLGAMGKKLLHCSNKAVARVIEHSSRMAEHQDRLSLHAADIANLLRESDYWARQAGAKLIQSSRRQKELERVKGTLGLERPDEDALVLPLDLGDLESLPAAAEKALAWKGRIDILINNGGVSTRCAPCPYLSSPSI